MLLNIPPQHWRIGRTALGMLAMAFALTLRAGAEGGAPPEMLSTESGDAAPTFTIHPAPASTTTGGHAVLTVSASGDLLEYQWFRGDSGEASLPVPGATSHLLLTPALREATSFWVRVSNPHGTVDSDAAAVAVTNPIPCRLLASGLNSTGQLGNGTTTSRNSLGVIFQNVITAAAGGSHSLFVTTDGTLMAMGSNNIGQLGDGSNTARTSPVTITSGVAAVACGSSHSMFLKTDGTLWVNGSGNEGQLGFGTISRNTPIQVATNVASIAAGAAHSLFVKTDGTLWATGRNWSGQLGDGTTQQRNSPVQIAQGVVLAAAGESHSLFLKADGSLWAMGSNVSGRLGDGTTTQRIVPVQVAEEVISAAAGNSHSVFLTSNGELRAMGSNNSGQLGDGTTTTRTTPVTVRTGVSHISAGGIHTHFTTTDRSLMAAGANGNGQLGDGSNTNRPTPVYVASHVAMAAGGNSHSLVLDLSPTITLEPGDADTPLGGVVVLRVETADVGEISYQWFSGTSGDTSAPITDATSSTLTTPPAVADADFWVRVSNSYAHVDSRTASVLMVGAPAITAPPQPYVVAAGSAVVMQVAAEDRALRYQWYRGASGDVSQPISRATGPLLVAPPLRAAEDFWVRVSNSAGDADSPSATATPGPPLDARLLATGSNANGQLGDDTRFNRTSFTPVASGVATAAAGDSHSLFVKSDGSLWAMGQNTYGQLGDGTAIDRCAPVPIATAVMSASAGGSHSLFVDHVGGLWAMGRNSWGQLGDGTTTLRNAPVPIASGVDAVAGGVNHSLFLKSDGSLWAMGINTNGRLGDGTTTFRSTPVWIADEVAAIAAGDSHSLFIKIDGSLWAMGLNNSGQLGDGTTTQRLAPVRVAEGVALASAGGSSSWIIKADGSLWTTTSGSSGSSWVPIASGVMSVAAGWNHVLFVKVDGSRWAMGDGNNGKLGDGSATNRTTPVPVGVATAAIAAGRQHSLALDLIPAITAQPADGGAAAGGDVSLSVTASGPGPFAYQWYVGASGDTSQPIAGANSDSLMISSLDDSTTRWVRVSNAYGHADSRTAAISLLTQPSLTTAPASVSVADGENAAFSVVAGGGLLEYQWFRGNSGDTSVPVDGATSATIITLPVREVATYWVRVSNAIGSIDGPAVVASPVLPATTRVLASGSNSYGQLGDGTTTQQTAPVETATDSIAVAAGENHTLILRSDHSLWAVGFNTLGQLGDGTTNNRSSAVWIADDVRAISAGGIHSLFLRGDGTLFAMGSNDSGRLGDGTTTDRHTPVEVASGVVAMAAGGAHSLFIKADGTLWAAGSNSDGQLGDGTFENRSTPVQIASGVADVAAGSSFSVFLKVDGSVWTMGRNDFGQIGDATQASRGEPVRVSDGGARIAAGNHHVLMVKTDGSLWGNGLNSNGQLGIGNFVSQFAPVPITTGVVDVAAGGSHSTFITTSGILRAMGGNSSGQLGDGTISQRNQPVTIASHVVTVAGGGAHTAFRDLKPAIRQQPIDLNVAAGATPTLTVAASGQGPFFYQWYRGASGDISQPVNGAEADSFTVPPMAETASWWVRVTTTLGTADSRSAEVLRVALPEITLQPSATAVETQASGALRAAANGDAIMWQWYRGESGDTSQPVAGAIGPLLVTPPLDASESFWARVSNGAGHADTASALVSMTPPLPARLRLGGANSYGQLGDGTTTNRSTPWTYGANVSRADGGDSHSLFVKSDGSLWAMGRNNIGQLGDGTTTNRHTPVQISADVREVAAAGSQSLFVKTDGTLWAMGSNSFGQLGDGTTTFRPSPVQVADDVRLVAAGSRHSMFLKTDGTLWAMGNNDFGQLGDGTTTQRTSPVQIAADVAFFDAGQYHSMFVKSDGSLWGMGDNFSGQLGIGNTTNQHTPVKIADGVVAVACGGSHSLFVTADGTLQGMGTNSPGQLGDGTTSRRTSPVVVATGIVGIAAGGSHSFAIKDDGTLWATGSNGFGQLGNGTTISRSSFQQVGTAAVSVAAGTTHSLIRDRFPVLASQPADSSAPAGGTANLAVVAEGVGPFFYQWYGGESGDTSAPYPEGDEATFTIPPLAETSRFWVRVSNASSYVDSTAATVTLVHPPQITTLNPLGAMLEVSATGDVLSYQWFRGNPGDVSQPVPGGTAPQLLPPPITADTMFWVRVSNAAGSVDSAAVEVTHAPALGGRLLAVGGNSDGQLGIGGNADPRWHSVVTGDVRAVSAGNSHSLFVKTDGSLWAMGSNIFGQLGLGGGGSFSRDRPMWVADDVAQAAAGLSHSLFVKTDGTLWAMGFNGLGQLGDGTTTSRAVPVQVAEDVARAAAGTNHSLYLKTDGTLWAMGTNSSGQLGDGTTTHRSVPVQIATDVMDISAGNSFSLFVKSDGTLWAMGANDYGQLGDGTTTPRPSPVQVADGVVRVAAGSLHSLFIQANGALWAMGYNWPGRLGDGTTTTRLLPVPIASQVVAARAGTEHSQFIKTDGTLWVMGDNRYGQLGDGTNRSRNTPAPIASHVLDASAGGFHSLILDGVPFIESEPVDAGVVSGNPTALGVVASGPGELTYQWYAYTSGDTLEPITGATSAIWETPGITADAEFWVRVSNASGSADSRTVHVRVVTSPIIDGPPELLANGALRIAASGGVLDYQWFQGEAGDTSEPVAGANAAILVRNPLAPHATYWVRVSNAAGEADSGPITLMHSPPLSARLLATGSNNSGQLGDGTSVSRNSPQPLASRISAMAAGTAHALYVTDEGVLWGTGRNTNGQLGIGTDGGNQYSPVMIESDVHHVAAGIAHSLFIKTDGSLWGMGSNGGRLGDGTTTARSTPVWIAVDVVTAAAGSSHSMLVRSDGRLWAMGVNSNGQLGDGTTTSRTTPVLVAEAVRDVAVGNNHSLFLKTDGSLWAMGANSDGQLGDGTATTRFMPVQVASNVARIAAAENQSLFIKSDGSLWAMGANYFGRLGDGTSFNRDWPIFIEDGVVSVSAGSSHSVFVKADGSMWAMGSNVSGRLGDGTTHSRTTPGQSATSVVAVAAGGDFTWLLDLRPSILAEPADAGVAGGDSATLIAAASPDPLEWQWYAGPSGDVSAPVAGANSATFITPPVMDESSYWARVSNEHGSTDTRAATVVPVDSPSFDTEPLSQSITTGGNAVLTVSANGGMPAFQWYQGEAGDISNPVAGAQSNVFITPPLATETTFWVRVTNAEGSADSEAATVAVAPPVPGFLSAAGSKTLGQLGTGAMNAWLDFAPIADEVADVASSDSHILVLKTDGTLWGAGSNQSGQLGDSEWHESDSFVQIAEGVASIAAANERTLFVKTDGTLWLMGNHYGSNPHQKLSGVARAWIGGTTIYYLDTSSTLRSQWWTGSSTSLIATGVVDFSAGPTHQLFIKNDGTLWGIGNNHYGQLYQDYAFFPDGGPVKLADDVLKAATGERHSLFLKTDGTLWGMGSNADGQLATSGAVGTSLPQMLIAAGVTDLAAGIYHGLMVKNDGSLWSFGRNAGGELGDGTTASRHAPMRVAEQVDRVFAGNQTSYFATEDGILWGAGLGVMGEADVLNSPIRGHVADDIIAVSAGGSHSLIIDADGRLLAMGNNDKGQLGDGTRIPRARPVEIADDVSYIAAGLNHSLFIRSDGTLLAMGANANGQLGDGTTTDRDVPVEIATGVVSVAAGASHNMFLKDDGTLWAMGLNSAGQLGDGSSTRRLLPVEIAADVVAFAAGSAHSLWVKRDGTLWAMGSNTRGQLGTGDVIQRFVPVRVADGVMAVAAGTFHSHFLRVDGTLWSMGLNSSGQLGDGTTTNIRVSPVQIADNVVEIRAGNAHGQFRTADGNLWAMGHNADGRLGDHTTTIRRMPQFVESGVFTASAGGRHSLWVGTMRDRTLTTIAEHPKSVWLETGAIATLSVDALGEAVSYQWYRGFPGDTSQPLYYASLTEDFEEAGIYWLRANGDANTADSRAAQVTFLDPPKITTQPHVVSYEAGGGVTLAVAADGAWSYQWFVGDFWDDSRPITGATNATLLTHPLHSPTTYWVRAINGAGNVESDLITVAPPPVSGRFLYGAGQSYGSSGPVELSGAVTHADTGANHGLYVTTDGTLWAIGSNKHGQLGSGGTQTATTPIRVADDVMAAAAGNAHSLFIRRNGSLWAMGRNARGQLGTGNAADALVPQWVADDVVAAAAGGNHSVFLKSDGSLWTMGANQSGQLGDGTSTDRHSPVNIANEVSVIAAGEAHSLFAKVDGTMWTMGDNGSSRLGDGTTTSRWIPVRVADGVAMVAAGGQHSLLVRNDGSLWGMGENSNLQLSHAANNISIQYLSYMLPFNAPVIIAADATAAVAGGLHSLHIKRDGTMWGGGGNSNRQLSIETSFSSSALLEARAFVHAVSAAGNNTFYLAANSADQPPAILDHPQSVFIDPGNNATLGVFATGSGPLSYQWFRGRPGDTSTPVGGGTAASLVVTPAAAASEYWVRVTNTAAYADSRAATVITAPTSEDYRAWATAHGLLGLALDPNADPDGDGRPNVLEFALGTHPLLPDAATMSVDPPPAQGGAEITLRVRASAGLVVTLQYSETLTAWESATFEFTDGVWTTNDPLLDVTDAIAMGDGLWYLTLRHATAGTRFFIRVAAGMTTADPPATTAYDDWAIAAGLVGADADPAADPDGDGLSNLTEFAFATHPLIPTGAALRPLGGLVSGEDESFIAISHRRRTHDAPITVYQWSDDLMTWHDFSPAITVLNADPDLDGQAELVRAARVRGVDESQIFLRIRHSLP